MRSQIPGCARLCNACPKRPLRAVLFTSEVLDAARADQNYEWQEVDSQEVNEVTVTKVYRFADYGKVTNDTPYTPRAHVRLTNTLYPNNNGVSLEFPATITLDMVEACTGPKKVRHHWWQLAEKRCGAYKVALELVEPEDRERYDRFLGH